MLLPKFSVFKVPSIGMLKLIFTLLKYATYTKVEFLKWQNLTFSIKESKLLSKTNNVFLIVSLQTNRFPRSA